MSGELKAKCLDWTPELITRFWNYQSQFPRNYFAYQYGPGIVAALHARVPPPARILDYACGPGFLVPELLDRGYRVAAADQSPLSVDRANQQFADRVGFEGAFLMSELGKLGQFDVAIMSELVEHLEDEQLDGALRDIGATVRAGGFLLVTTPNDEDLQASTVYCPNCDHTFHQWQHVRNWSAPRLADYLRSRRFDPKVVKQTDFGLHARSPLRRTAGRLRYILSGRKYPHLWCLAKVV